MTFIIASSTAGDCDCDIQHHKVARPSSSALTIEGDACGMPSTAPSRKGRTSSGLPHTGSSSALEMTKTGEKPADKKGSVHDVEAPQTSI